VKKRDTFVGKVLNRFFVDKIIAMNIKQYILHGVEFAGLNRLARYRTRRRLLGLAYHSVVSDSSPEDDARTNIAVTVSQFELQLQKLRRHWNPVSLEQVRNAVLHGEALPDNAVHVSFDDGYRNNLTLAAPLLAKYEIPALIFVTTNFIGSQDKLLWSLEMQERLVAWSDSAIELAGKSYLLSAPETPQRTRQVGEIVTAAKRLPLQERQAFLDILRRQTKLDLSPSWKRELYEFMDWDEVRSLRAKGIDIGAHTVSHPILSHLDLLDVERELKESKIRIEQELALECDALAYPFGSVYDYSGDVIEITKRLGFRLAFTLQNHRNAESIDPMRIHRICITRDLTLHSFRAIISGIRGI
jgi:peptidoglycan/xylan/chitin deacetylase (PgdA/CDA1 family)